MDWVEIFDWIMSDFKTHYSKLCYRQKEFEQVLARREEFEDIKDPEEFVNKLIDVLNILQDMHIRARTHTGTKKMCKPRNKPLKNYSDTIYTKIFGHNTTQDAILTKELENNTLYILTNTFSYSKQLKTQIKALRKTLDENYFDKIILDLRPNQGGRGDISAKFAALFAEKGKEIPYCYLLKREDPHNPCAFYKKRESFYGYATKQQGKLILLVGQKTASAGEGVTLRLKAIGATLVGDRTRGDSAGPRRFEFGPILVDIPSWVVTDLNGTVLLDIGIKPDIYIPPEQSIIDGEDKVLQKALEL